jgi:hypothetical protein
MEILNRGSIEQRASRYEDIVVIVQLGKIERSTACEGLRMHE